MTTPSPIQLPAPAPLLTRGGWSAFIVALIVVCAVAPVLNLWVPAGSMFHLSRLRRGAARQDHVLRHLRAGHGPDLGLHRHPEPGPRPVLCAGRLRDGHVPHAPDWPRRQLQERPARLHGVPGLEGAALALGAVRQLHRHADPDRGGARRDCVCVRLLCLPLAHQGCVLLHHHAGHDLCGHAAVLPQRNRLWRQQRLYRFQAHPGHAHCHTEHAHDAVCADGFVAAGLLFCWPAGWCAASSAACCRRCAMPKAASCSRATRRCPTSSPSGPSAP